MKKRVVFISNTSYPVDNTGGGNVVIYRHLKRLENEGHQIVIVNSLVNNNYQSPFKEIKIIKKKWYPPLRKQTPLFTDFRIWCDYLRLTEQLVIDNKDVVISILGEQYNLLALKIAKKYQIPLYFFCHDDSLFNHFSRFSSLTKKHINHIFEYSNCILSVSNQMSIVLMQNGAKKVELLYPIPAIKNPNVFSPIWKNEFGIKVNLGFSGLLFSDLHKEILTKVLASLKSQGSLLHLFTNDKRSEIITELSQQFDNLILHPSQPTVYQLFNSFIDSASALLVFYSFKKDKEHRMFTSFPSKLIEYMAVGLPIIIIAPPESTLGIWAIENKWPLYVGEDNGNLIAEKLTSLKNIDFWNKCVSKCDEISATIFNPENIHKQFKSILNIY